MNDSTPLNTKANRQPTHLVAAEFSLTTYALIPEHGITLEDALRPDYWVHVARQLKMGDRIEVTAPDVSWVATLVVRSVSAHSAVMGVLAQVDFEKGTMAPVTASTDMPHGYEMQWQGIGKKYAIVRASDRAILKEGIPSKEGARKWAMEHAKAAAL